MPITRAMEEQLRQLVFAFAAFQEKMEGVVSSVKEEMKAVQEKMEADQESVKEKIQAGKEEMKREITCIKGNKFEVMESRTDSVENKVGQIEENVSSVKEQIKQRVSAVEQQIDSRVSSVKERIEERFSVVEQRIEGRVSAVQQQIDDRVSAVAKEVDALKKFVATAGSNTDGFKFLPMPVRPLQKLSTLFQKTRLHFEALSCAMELRVGEKCLKDYSSLPLNSRRQKPAEILQELATDVERLSHLAFTECPRETREILSLQNFIDGIRDPVIQKALRMADVKALKSAVVYTMKFVAAQQATRRDRHPIRAAQVQGPADQMAACLNDLTRQLNALKQNIGDKKPTVKCWKYGSGEHIRRNCSTPQGTDVKTCLSKGRETN
ncbi:hypothetical protein X975_14885, partial [Stegodyphus mimosarum]